jgi:paraquat-inducible protein B
MKARANPALIGGFVVGAIALGVIAVVLLGSGRFFSNNVEFVALFPGSINGLAVGAPVKFKGVEVGRVTRVQIAIDEAFAEDFRIPVFFELDPAKLTRQGAPIDRRDLRDRELLADLYKQGLRAQLVPESFVTGVLYIELDMHPDTPSELQLGADSKLREIPTLPTTLERAASAATQILAKIDEIDFDGLVAALNNTVVEVNKLLASPELKDVSKNLNKVLTAADEAIESVRTLATSARGDINGLTRSAQHALDGTAKTLEKLDSTLVEARKTLDSLGGLVEPESPVIYQVGQTLQSVDEAARSVRRLADTIERNPSTVVFGRSVEGAK